MVLECQVRGSIEDNDSDLVGPFRSLAKLDRYDRAWA